MLISGKSIHTKHIEEDAEILDYWTTIHSKILLTTGADVNVNGPIYTIIIVNNNSYNYHVYHDNVSLISTVKFSVWNFHLF